MRGFPIVFQLGYLNFLLVSRLSTILFYSLTLFCNVEVCKYRLRAYILIYFTYLKTNNNLFNLFKRTSVSLSTGVFFLLTLRYNQEVCKYRLQTYILIYFTYLKTCNNIFDIFSNSFCFSVVV